MRINRGFRRKINTLGRSPLTVALLASISSLMATPVLAQTCIGTSCLPHYGEVREGSVTSNYMDRNGVIRPGFDASLGNTMTLNQSTSGAIIDWRQFHLDNGFQVQITGGPNIVTLNRVIGYGGQLDHSYINGSIQSSGHFFIINPAGITFGPNAAVNVGGLLASTLDVDNNEFMAAAAAQGQYRFFHNTNYDLANIGSINNQGTLETVGGMLSFVGPDVRNYGQMQAGSNSIAMAAGTQVVLDFHGDGLTRIVMPSGQSPAVRVWMEGSTVANDGNIFLHSSGGDINVIGNLQANGLAANNGRIELIATGEGNINIDRDTAVSLVNTHISSEAGNIAVRGVSESGAGVSFDQLSTIRSISGGIRVTGIGAGTGLTLNRDEVQTQSGYLDLRGRGLGNDAVGLVIGDGVSLTTQGGMSLSGEGTGGAGVGIGNGAQLQAGELISIRAANNGSSDALRIAGTVSSNRGVNLRPGGVDTSGELYDRVNEQIVLGGAARGFALSQDEINRINAPELVIGHAQHTATITVAAALGRDGNFSLQTAGDIALNAGLDMGQGTLALLAGGDIGQDAQGAIRAHSLLAMAGGDVLLDQADNDVAANTLAGSAGGQFRYRDIDALRVGSVGASAMNAGGNGLSQYQANGIQAGGDVLVRILAGDLFLAADIAGAEIDIVAANSFQNLVSANLNAAGNWRVWAGNWEGEVRGGLMGGNLYGCVYAGNCGFNIPAGSNHFIYARQTMTPPAMAITGIGGELGDSVALGTDTYVYDSNFGSAPMCPIAILDGSIEGLAGAGDNLTREWSKVRDRPNLSNCINTERKNSCSDF